MVIKDTKNKNGPGWSCSRCGYMNFGTDVVCMGAKMGNGLCGNKKSPPSKNPILSVGSVPPICIDEQRGCDACGLEESERITRGCH